MTRRHDQLPDDGFRHTEADDRRRQAAAAEHSVAQRFRLALPLYLCLLLLLALVGIVNQGLFRTQVALLDSKQALQAEFAAAQLRAAGVAGPEAVAVWAESNGMVTVPEAGTARLVAPAPAPSFTLLEPTLELNTVWR